MKLNLRYIRVTSLSLLATAGLACVCTIAPGRAEQFTIAVIPDTQNYTMSDANMAGFTAQMNYVAAHRASQNIVFATHLGDMVESGASGWPHQWERARTAMNILREADVLCGIAIGNHDYDSRSPSVSGTTVWSSYFGPDSDFFQGRPWYHSNPTNAPDSYQVFYGADRAFLHIVLEYQPSAASFQWAQQVIQAHLGMPTIVSLHNYLFSSGGRSSTGNQVWYDLINPNPQIFLVLCGHHYSVDTGLGEATSVSFNASGQAVYELLSDYQGVGGTGNGWMRLMQFDSDLQCINVTTYSPLLDSWRTNSTSQFTLSFDWNVRFGPAPGQLPPLLITPPASQAVPFGSDAAFRVLAAGAAPLSYQWLKGGVNLSDGGNVSGVHTSTLILSHVLAGDAGGYSVVISNDAGAVTSVLATLTVLDPAITSHPVSQSRQLGQSATFSVTAAGTPPLSYQWWKDAAALAEPAGPSLTLTNLQGADAGSYWVVVSNLYGSVTSLVARLSVSDPLIASQPVSQEANAGETVTFSVIAEGTLPLSFQWWKDGAALAEATRPSLTLTNLQAADASSYWVVVSNPYGSVTSTVALLTLNLATVDLGFNPGADGVVRALAVQPDGKILVGGKFSTLAGQSRNCIGRLHADGSLDSGFNARANDDVYSLAVQADGKILVGGEFDNLCGQGRSYIGRLNPDGSLDTASICVANRMVESLAVQADGKIVVVGSFTYLGSYNRNRIGRLNADGTLDTTFNPGANSYVFSLALQPDGKILVGGAFSSLGGQARIGIGRLNADGSVDASFNPSASGVNCLAVQADGKILLGGGFIAVGGQPRYKLARLHADGTLDLSFNPGADASIAYIWSLAVQTDGKILVAGNFTRLAGQPRSHLARLHSDGTLDSTFNLGAGGTVHPWAVCSLAVQPDGSILVGGDFTALGGETRSRIGRLNNTEPATQSLSYAGGALAWLRGGTSPEAWRATFEVSTNNGANWFALGPATRISGGWHVACPSFNASPSICARGFVAAGYDNGSGWFAESIIGPVVVLTHPPSRTNLAGTTATLSMRAGGSPPLSYLWLKNGINLTDGGHVSGVQTPVLTLANVSGGDAGGYSVVISNGFGSVTSRVATLTVLDPFITSQPLSQGRQPSQSVTFTCTCGGTPPFSYQWWKDGGTLAQATGSSLTLTNLQGADAGGYRMVFSNPYGSVTSAVALLSVNVATLDSAFNPGAAGSVFTTPIQPDGKILVGGSFSTLGGQPRDCIGRLKGDGTLDPSFNPGANSSVFSLALQADGKILAGGEFSTLGGQPRNCIGRLNGDGTLDASFNPGANGSVRCLAVQPDGKIVVGGNFTTLGGQTRNYIGRLNSNGTLDTSFNPGTTSPIPRTDHCVNSLAVQTDGRILVGGGFYKLAGQPRLFIGRLYSNGTLDTTFNPEADWEVHLLAVQTDGKILVCGGFTTLAGQARPYLGRLNPNGVLDSGFSPGAGGTVCSLAVQADGRILLGGDFATLGGASRNSLGRLSSDGTLDLNFNPETGGSVRSLAVQPDGSILVGGDFTALGGETRSRIARLNNTDPATQSLSYDGGTLTWLRGGTSPEVWRTTFEVSTNNGTSWLALGTGMRIAAGWRLAGPSVPANANIRARGFVAAGYHNGSPWLVETKIITAAPVILTQPASRTNNIGTDATFGVVVEGTPTLHYQWRKDGTNLLGATASTCTLPGIQHRDEGLYSVGVSNAFGSALSSDAMLVINHAPVADASATQPVVISANGTDATVILNGSRSSDPDGDPLQYLWLSTINHQSSTTLASGAVALVVLPVGAHPLLLVVDDGMLTATNALTVEVITAAQAVDRLVAQVARSWPRSQPLLASLSAALRSTERGNLVAAVNQLQAFQNKARAQVTRSDPALAATFIQAAHEIIDVLSDGGAKPAGRSHGRFMAGKHEPNSSGQLQFAAEPGRTHIVEASTNLVDWEMIGVAVEQADGTFTFDDPNAARFPNRFYRLVSP